MRASARGSAGRSAGPLARLAGRLGGLALDALFPPHCLACEEPVSAQGTMCAACFGSLRFVAGPVCKVCGVPEPTTGGRLCADCARRPPIPGQARAALVYDEGSRRLILPFKHGDRTELAAPLARHMARAGAELLRGCDLVVPVPLHRRRLLQRRHNQAALLAAALAKTGGKRFAPYVLERPRATIPLGDLGATEREIALRGAVSVVRRHADQVAGKSVLLVDDVMSSGATANACATALLATGARAVHTLVAARALKHSPNG